VAVRELSFRIAPGEVLGLVGESGSGKSVTSLALMRLLPPQAHVAGQVLFTNGSSHLQPLLELPEPEMRRLRGSSLAMIFQEPMTSLNPVMRVGDQIAEARDYPHQLSGGMRQRVMIAMALVNHPKLLIADEPTTALDVTIQAQILTLLAGLRTKYNLAMLFISHDLAVVSQVADRVAVMYAGNLVEMGPTQAVFRQPAHPYTRGLLHAAPTLTTDRRQPLHTIEGSVPAPSAMPPGCPFSPRCAHRISECDFELPPLVPVAPGQLARCPVINPGVGLPRGV
jgi:oligopeptide/dipeptide ABC transporter ATP-binding protein